MASVTRRRVMRTGLLGSIKQALPQIAVAAIVGLAVYNPSGYSLYDLIVVVFRDGFGVFENTVWFYQPAYWGVAIMVGLLALGIYFHYEIVVDELVYFFGFILAVVLLNGFILAAFHVVAQMELFSWSWAHWQISPVMFAAVMFAAKVPKARKAHTGAFTAGGGTLSTTGDFSDPDCD